MADGASPSSLFRRRRGGSSLTVAASRRLHRAQPWLSRQIRDLDLELGVTLLERGPRVPAAFRGDAPLAGEPPVIDLSLAYSAVNASPLRATWLERVDALQQRIVTTPAGR